MEYGGHIVVTGHFFLHSSLLIDKVHDYLFCFCFFNFSHHTFDLLFRSYFFYKSFVWFQFSPLITISHMFFFSFQFLFFWFLIYFLGPSVKILLVFNFILQSKFFVFAFSIINLYFFISYFVLILFINVFFIFNLILQLQFLICFFFYFGPFLLIIYLFPWSFC